MKFQFILTLNFLKRERTTEKELRCLIQQFVVNIRNKKIEKSKMGIDFIIASCRELFSGHFETFFLVLRSSV
jgi:hypothetical protein